MLTECPACRGLVRLGEKERHSEQECPERSLSCRHCRAPCCWADLKVRASSRAPLAPRAPTPSLPARCCGRCGVFAASLQSVARSHLGGRCLVGTRADLKAEPSGFKNLFYFRKTHTEGAAAPGLGHPPWSMPVSPRAWRHVAPPAC